MEIDKAKWYLKDHAKTTMNNTFIEATNEVLDYLYELENKLNNKEKVYTIDQEEIILKIINLNKILDNVRKRKEQDYEKTISPTKRAIKHHELDLINERQRVYKEIIDLIRSL